jgi:hypothetical protein
MAVSGGKDQGSALVAGALVEAGLVVACVGLQAASAAPAAATLVTCRNRRREMVRFGSIEFLLN